MFDGKGIKEVMIPISEYPRVYETDTLQTAITTLKNHHNTGKEHRSLMVFNKNNELTGILTARVILDIMKSQKLIFNSTELFNLSYSRFFHKVPPHDEQGVKSAMRPVALAYIEANDNISNAIEIMMEKNINSVPVMENNKVIGVLRSIDLLDYLLS